MVSSEFTNENAALSLNAARAVCPRCDWKFLLPDGAASRRCPNCFRAELEQSGEALLEGGDGLQTIFPELIIPPALSKHVLAERVRRFASGIPFAPADLVPQNLISRMQTVFLPTYLVDVAVEAGWSMDAGFNYQVVSHQERYSDGAGGWKTREVQETRVHWEPRLGRLDRTYHNIPAPALEEHAALRSSLGSFDLSAAQPYESPTSGGGWVRLPDRSSQDAWPDAVPGLQTLAAAECQQAVEADFTRDFRWSPAYKGQTWTLLLAPVFTSYYLDDEGQPQAVWINGQSGVTSGLRRASNRRARRAAWIILAAAATLFVLSLIMGTAGVIFPALLPVALIGVVLAVLAALGALAPVYTAWSFNRKDSQGR